MKKVLLGLSLLVVVNLFAIEIEDEKQEAGSNDKIVFKVIREGKTYFSDGRVDYEFIKTNNGYKYIDYNSLGVVRKVINYSKQGLLDGESTEYYTAYSHSKKSNDYGVDKKRIKSLKEYAMGRQCGKYTLFDKDGIPKENKMFEDCQALRKTVEEQMRIATDDAKKITAEKQKERDSIIK